MNKSKFPKANPKYFHDYSKELPVKFFMKLPYGFVKVADCYLNTSENFSGRAQYIESITKFLVLVDAKPYNNELWKMGGEHVYLLAIDDNVVKIGSTTTSMKDRWGSYKCGTRKYMKKGSPSTTNYHIQESLYASLLKKQKVEIYSIRMPELYKSLDVYGTKLRIPCSVSKAYEHTLLDIYKAHTGHYPILSVNNGTNGVKHD